jgi:hypothetical protein
VYIGRGHSVVTSTTERSKNEENMAQEWMWGGLVIGVAGVNGGRCIEGVAGCERLGLLVDLEENNELCSAGIGAS